MNRLKIISLYRIFTAILVFAAVITQLMYGLSGNNFSVANFLSFFTIQSNIFGACVFIVMGILAWRGINTERFAYVRGAATTYMTITGIIYVLLLSNVDVQTPLPWVNLVLHYIFPVIIIIDWLVDNPIRTIYLKKAMLWLIYPLIYAVYSLVRGDITNWYPYPFLNVNQLGYVEVLINSLFVAAATLLIISTITGLSKISSKD